MLDKYTESSIYVNNSLQGKVTWPYDYMPQLLRFTRGITVFDLSEESSLLNNYLVVICIFYWETTCMFALKLAICLQFILFIHVIISSTFSQCYESRKLYLPFKSRKLHKIRWLKFFKKCNKLSQTCNMTCDAETILQKKRKIINLGCLIVDIITLHMAQTKRFGALFSKCVNNIRFYNLLEFDKLK